MGNQAGWSNLNGGPDKLDANETAVALLMLQRAGLVREIVGTFLSYSGGTFVITPIFRKLMVYLSSPATSQLAQPDSPSARGLPRGR